MNYLLSVFKELTLFSYVIIGILLLMSVISWAIIFYKCVQLNLIKVKNGLFIRAFEKKSRFSEINQILPRHKSALSADMFQVVNNEYNVFRSKIPAQDNISAEDTHLIAAVLERTVEKTILRQAKSMERYLLFLATVSSSAPFIGLLGTVIGITFSFRSITAQGSAGLSVVAPGIAEALIATALGLFAAIPALFAYNTFRSQIKNTVTDQRVFGLQLINLLVRASRWKQ